MTYYTIFNRTFQNRADAEKYCNDCDFSPEFIREKNPIEEINQLIEKKLSKVDFLKNQAEKAKKENPRELQIILIMRQ